MLKGSRARRRGALLGLLVALLVLPRPAREIIAGSATIATPIDRPPACLLQVSGYDAGGNRVLSTVGHALDHPGLLVAPLHELEKGGVRWETLRVAPDPGRPGPQADRPGLAITGMVAADPARNLLLLRAPGLEPCAEAPATSGTPEPGAALLGVRGRDGYRSPLFHATVDRSARVPGGPAVLRIAIGDGSGAGGGFLLDGEGRLHGILLPAPAGADPGFACAVALDPEALSGIEASDAGDPRAAVAAAPRASVLDEPAGILAHAMLLTRIDQASRALRLLDDLERRSGGFPALHLERGAWHYRVGRTDLAIEDFSRAVRADPSSHLARYNLGIALGGAGRYDDAATALEAALEIVPGHPMTRYHLALALLAADRSAAAHRQYEELAGLDPLLAADLRALAGF